MAAANDQKKYDPGARDSEIKIGQTMPFSGPASAYAAYGNAEAAYFRMINDQGGVNGRSISFPLLMMRRRAGVPIRPRGERFVDRGHYQQWPSSGQPCR